MVIGWLIESNAWDHPSHSPFIRSFRFGQSFTLSKGTPREVAPDLYGAQKKPPFPPQVSFSPRLWTCGLLVFSFSAIASCDLFVCGAGKGSLNSTTKKSAPFGLAVFGGVFEKFYCNSIYEKFLL